MQRLGSVLLLAVLTSCATRAKAPRAPTIADADRLATAGCYTCLLDALEMYDGILARRASVAATRGAFRTALLLALREKEVGLRATPYLERARALSSSLPAEDDAGLALAIADAQPWDYSGLTKEFTEQFIKTRQAVTPQVKGWRDRLRTRRADPFFAYLDASLACSYGDWRGRDAALDEVAAQQPSSLLVKYRVGACVQSRRAALEEVLAAEPRFAEAHLFLGRYALVDASTGHAKRSVVAPHLEAAYAAFPKSASVTFTLAGMYRAFTKLEDALRFYDETLALVPTHREAMLGRIIALTYTQQPDPAIATATRMIELGEWYIGDAYYWRAFNLHEQKQLDAARDDVERAKGLARLRSDVFLLAGIIYYDRRELDAAVPDLEKAWQLNDTECDAAWYLGLVRSEQKTWDVAAAMFPKGAACYRSRADVYGAELGAFQATVEGTAERAALDANYQRLIEQQLVGESRSYYNAAFASAQRGERDRAIEYAERAAQHPVMKSKAAELIAALKKNP
jgi:tetratricopeptide (TPR) repeat protein